MSGIVGYVVTDKEGSARCIGHYEDTPQRGVLLSGDAFTLFRSRRTAYRAIERTTLYEQDHGLNWRSWELRVVAVKR